MKLDSNLIAIVTGGASGLGQALCSLLAQCKVKLIVADINTSLAESFIKTLPTEVYFVQTDVSSESSIQTLIASTLKLFKAIHIVINCAGIHNLWPLITDDGKVAPTSEFNKVFNTNVLGTFNMTKYSAKQMIIQPFINDFKEKGVIINISSIQGIEGMKSRIIYAASKGAIIAMTLPMARDLGKYGIRVCCIAPGAFMTPMQGEMSQEVKKQDEKQIPLGRIGEAKEFADFVLGMIENSYITGVTARLDGGMIISADL